MRQKNIPSLELESEENLLQSLPNQIFDIALYHWFQVPFYFHHPDCHCCLNVFQGKEPRLWDGLRRGFWLCPLALWLCAGLPFPPNPCREHGLWPPYIWHLTRFPVSLPGVWISPQLINFSFKLHLQYVLDLEFLPDPQYFGDQREVSFSILKTFTIYV